MTDQPLSPNPAGGLAISEIRRLREQMHVDLLRLQRSTEGKSEDMFFLPHLSTQRLQLSELVVIPNNSAVYLLRVGALTMFAFETAGSGVLTFKLPRVIEAGTQVLITTAAGVEVVYGPGATELYAAYLIGHAEEAPPQDPHDANLIDG